MIKYLVWHECAGKHVNGYIMPNHYSHSLDVYNDLARQAKEAFPHLTDEYIECRTVIDSGWCKGRPIVRFYLGPWKGEVPDGWKLLDYSQIDFRTS